jgi:NADH-quinone oxidoreductase subunit M
LGAAHWFPWIVWLALGNIILIGLITMAQKDLKMMLGYSSVMHMGYAFLGIASFSVAGAGGALLMMVAHGLSVALLFMLSTCIYHRSQTFDLSSMGGLATQAPVLAGFFVAATMASIGLPSFGNFWGEFTIFVALAETDMTKWIVAPAAIGIVISAIYGLRAVSNIFFGQAKGPFQERLESGQIIDLQAFEKLPACLLLGGLLLTGIFPRILSDDANRELAVLYPQEQSNLPVIESVVLPAKAGAPKELTH